MVQDIATFDPDVIMIGWCYSQFGDLSLALRRSAQFSKMIITHDLRVVTGKPTAKLDEVQERLLMDIGMGKFLGIIFFIVIFYFQLRVQLVEISCCGEVLAPAKPS